MAEVLPVTLIASSIFSVILLVVNDKNILEICAFYFVGPHKHNNISMMFQKCWHLIFLLHPTALHENITLQLRSFLLEDEITTLSH